MAVHQWRLQGSNNARGCGGIRGMDTAEEGYVGGLSLCHVLMMFSGVRLVMVQ
jgi:hypothetical protein